MSTDQPQTTRSLLYIGRCAGVLAFALLATSTVYAQLKREADNAGGDEGHPSQNSTLSVPLSGTGVEARLSVSTPSPVLFSAPANSQTNDGTKAPITRTGTGANEGVVKGAGLRDN